MAPRARTRRIALGVFDGVHLGHREVIRGSDCVVTFDPHPVEVLAPGNAPPALTTLDRRRELLAALGVRDVVVLPFDGAFARLSAQSFIDDVLVGSLGAGHVSVGEDFRFGHGGAGDTALLARDERFCTRVVPLVRIGGRVVSSTAIRELLRAGDVAGAARLLGAPFEIDVEPAVPIASDGHARLVARDGLAVPAPGRYACRVSAPGRAPRLETVEVGSEHIGLGTSRGDGVLAPCRIAFLGLVEGPVPRRVTASTGSAR
jgi:riboflavin kinase / FMN adenylyltransferase